MKITIALVTMAALSVCGAAMQAESKTPSASASHPDSGSLVKDLRVEVALFGSGTHLADVTDRVVELLRSKPEGFTAKAEWLRVDPAPGKNKSLMIRYRYHDQERVFLITGGNLASYVSMVDGEEEVRL